MGLLNLTLAQFLTVLIPLAGGLVALYFYDRSRRRIRVSTLRFWGQRSAPAVSRRHRKIQQPWSLILQLLAALLLLLAIADFQWEGSDEPRHHAILLDGSAAMLSQTSTGATAMDQARQSALDYLDALPAADPVALIRADAAPSVVVGYTIDRERMRQAIEEFDAGWTALRLDAALELAQSSLYLALGEPIDGPTPTTLGETTYVGAGQIATGSEPLTDLPYLRFIPARGGLDDVGIIRFAAVRPPTAPDVWQVSLELLNDSDTPRRVTATVEFDGRRLGERAVQLASRTSSVVEFRIRTSSPGTLETYVESDDGLLENNRVALELPAASRLPIAFNTSRIERWRTLIAANPAIVIADDDARVALRIADRGTTDASAQVWIDPRPGDSPVEITRRVNRPRITAWAPGHAVTQGLQETDVRLSAASVFDPEPGDVILVTSTEGPIAISRERDGNRLVVLGFDLLDPAAAGRLTGPLLFANIISWFAPEAFQSVAVEARPPGVLQVPLGTDDDSRVSVSTASGLRPIWFRHGDDLRLYRSEPGTLRVTTPSQNSRISMTLPAPGQTIWEPPPAVRRGVPTAAGGITGIAFWPWLSLLALALLFIDWRWFGDPSRFVAAPTSEATH